MIDRVNAALGIFGLRLMRLPDVALLIAAMSAIQNERDRMAVRVAVMRSALETIRVRLTANSERCLHCQADRVTQHGRQCPARIAVEAIAEGVDVRVVDGKEMN